MREHLPLIYSLYPVNISPSDLNYSNTREISNFFQVAAGAEENEGIFKEMSLAIYNDLKCVNMMDFSLRGIFDLCRKVVLALPLDAINEEFPFCMVNISVIAKYYCIYFTKLRGQPVHTLNSPVSQHQQDMIENQIVPIIKKFYPDYVEFPMQYFDEKVPGIHSSSKFNEYATYFECLVTKDIY